MKKKASFKLQMKDVSWNQWKDNLWQGAFISAYHIKSY